MLQSYALDPGPVLSTRAASDRSSDRNHQPEAALPAPGSAKPAQARLDLNKFVEKVHWGSHQNGYGLQRKTKERLADWIIAFNNTQYKQERSLWKMNQKTYLHTQIDRLDKIEHEIYSWFDGMTGYDVNHNRMAMFDLLDEVQVEHRELIAQTAETDTPLWVHDEVDDDERKKIDTLWEKIVTGTGGISYPNEIQTKGGMRNISPKMANKMRVDIMAQMARLMSRPNGRKLIEIITEKSESEGKGLIYKLKSMYTILGDNANPVVGPKALSEIEPFGMLNVNKIKICDQEGEYYTQGEGSNTEFEYIPGLKDSSFMDFDRDYNPILSPSFIGSGHELVHGAHYTRGLYLGPKSNSRKTKGLPEDYHRDYEEFFTIANRKEHKRLLNKMKRLHAFIPPTEDISIRKEVHVPPEYYFDLLEGIPTESDIREEHGLGRRHGHTTTANPYKFGHLQNWNPDIAQHDPGEYIKDGAEWMEEFRHLDPHYGIQPQTKPPGLLKYITGWES